MSLKIGIVETPLDPEGEMAAFRGRVAGDAGAVASFVGLVRGQGQDSLTLEHYPPLTQPMIEGFALEARREFDLTGLMVIHRVGVMAPGDPIVLVAAAARHRRAALDAVDQLMDRMKSEAPFWKQEQANGVRRWIEPRADDHAAFARWRSRDHIAPNHEED